MFRAPRARLLILLLLLETLLDGGEAKYASGARRSDRRRLTSDHSPALEQHQASSLLRCLNFCDGLVDCVALNFGRVSDTTNCQLLDQRTCDGVPLVADAGVDYFDVYDDPQNLTAETQTPFWDDPGCREDGYCAADCAAEAAGEFCTVDAHCSDKLKPPGAYQCVDGTCQLSYKFWELRTGLALPRWQFWRMDRGAWTWKMLKPDTCTLDIELKLGIGAAAEIMTSVTDEHTETRIVFKIDMLKTILTFFDKAGDGNIVQDADTSGMLTKGSFTRLRLSWCDGNLAIGPEDNPTQVTAKVVLSQSINFITNYSPRVDSWMYVDSGVADLWLFDDLGVAADAIMSVSPHAYIFRSINASNDVTVKYDCMAKSDCNVRLRGDEPHTLTICIGCEENTQSVIFYEDATIEASPWYRTGPVLSAFEFNTFTVRYNSGFVTVYRNDAAAPIYEVTVGRPVTNINLIGIGGSCCGHKFVRAARYDPGWRTDTWLTEGRGYSNGDEPELIG